MEISLERSCNCRDVWDVSQLQPGEEQHIRRDNVCLPSECQACIDRGAPCATRTNIAAECNYEPVQWSEVGPRPRYRRLK